MNKILLLSLTCFAFASPSSKTVVYDSKFIEKNFKYIPAGSFTMGNCGADQDVPYQSTNKCTTFSVQNFYMMDQEVSNLFYRQYLFESILNGDTLAYKNALPDTNVWITKRGYTQPYVDYYFRHPAYSQYPVVGVSREQCLKFCEWLTNSYNSSPKRKYKQVKFDLPTEEQWIWAARGGLANSPFPWAGPYMQNKNGEKLANFLQIDESSIVRIQLDQINYTDKHVKNEYIVVSGYGVNNMGVAGRTSDGADITAPVHSYWPNGYGLYNMSGNVEEIIKDKPITKGGSWYDPGYYLQINSKEEYADSNKVSNERGFRIIMNVVDNWKKTKDGI